MRSTASAAVSARTSGRAHPDGGAPPGPIPPGHRPQRLAPSPLEADAYVRGPAPSARSAGVAAGSTLALGSRPAPASPAASPAGSRTPSRSASPHGQTAPSAADSGPGPEAPRSRRPDLTRLGSTASAVVQVVPGAPAEVYAGLAQEMADAVEAARARERASGGLPRWLRKVLRRSRAGGLKAVAGKLAGPHEVGLSREQTFALLAALARGRAFRGREGLQQGPVLAGAPLPQPSMRPLLWFCDALFDEAYAICDTTRAIASDEQAVLSLRRTGFALLAARDALESYQAYRHTPGHKHLPGYLGMVRERYLWTEQRQSALVQKERTPGGD